MSDRKAVVKNADMSGKFPRPPPCLSARRWRERDEPRSRDRGAGRQRRGRGETSAAVRAGGPYAASAGHGMSAAVGRPASR